MSQAGSNNPEWMTKTSPVTLSRRKMDLIKKISREVVDAAVAEFLEKGGEIKKYSQTNGLVDSDYYDDPLEEKKEIDSVTSHYIGNEYLK